VHERLAYRFGPVRGETWVTAGTLLCLATFIAFYVRLFLLQDLLANVDAFLFIQTLIFVVYAALAFFVWRGMRGASGARISSAWYIGAAVIVASGLLLLRTNLSTDLYRYLWDGWLLKSGFNPYLILPTDPRLAAFQSSDLYQMMYWKNEYTPYPPVAQLIFAVAHTAYASIGLAAAKWVLALPVIILAAWFYRETERQWFALFALNPLLLFETFYGGHIDGWATLFAFFAYRQFAANSILLSAGLLAAGALTKVFPVIFLPLFLADLWKQKRRRDAAAYLAVFGAVVGVGYLPFTLTSPFAVLRLLSFARTFHFNAPVFSLLSQALQPIAGAGAEEIALRVSGVALVLALSYVAVRHRVSPLAISGVYTLYLLLTPQVYPWYTVFLVPMLFLSFHTSARRSPVFALIGMQLLLNLTYFVGSPAAYSASPGRKELASLIFMAIELLMTVAVVGLFRRASVAAASEAAAQDTAARNALLVIAKQPVAGRVKTRLGALFSPETKAEFYHCLILDTLALAERVRGVDRVVLFAPNGAEAYFRRLAPGFQHHPQRGADLGARLFHGLEDYLQRGYTRVVIVDSDSPTLPVACLERAFALLEESDVVLGPCDDGGYYLVGAKAAHAELFLGIEMSTPRVFAETAARAEAAGLKLAVLPKWYDIDSAADVQRLRAELACDGRLSLHTAQFLRRQQSS
jgi:uncharacterized protein